MDWVTDNLGDIVRLTFEHAMLTAISIAMALIIAVPLGIWIHGNHKRIAGINGATGVLYTIPSLALFAMLVPVLGLGRIPAILGLVAYAQLILVRGVVDALNAVPEDPREAAIGMGISPREVLFQVDLPLALPVFMASLRIATVTVIGIATIGAVVDAGGLGELILQGIQRSHVPRVLTGAVLVTILAVAVDFGLLKAEKRYMVWA